MDKTHRRTEKPCFFPYILFHSIPPYFRIEKGRVREEPPHAFPIGGGEEKIKGGGGRAFFQNVFLSHNERKGGDFILQEDFLGIIRRKLF